MQQQNCTFAMNFMVECFFYNLSITTYIQVVRIDNAKQQPF